MRSLPLRPHLEERTSQTHTPACSAGKSRPGVPRTRWERAGPGGVRDADPGTWASRARSQLGLADPPPLPLTGFLTTPAKAPPPARPELRPLPTGQRTRVGAPSLCALPGSTLRSGRFRGRVCARGAGGMLQVGVKEARVGKHGRARPGDLPVTTSTPFYLLGNWAGWGPRRRAGFLPAGGERDRYAGAPGDCPGSSRPPPAPK